MSDDAAWRELEICLGRLQAEEQALGLLDGACKLLAYREERGVHFYCEAHTPDLLSDCMHACPSDRPTVSDLLAYVQGLLDGVRCTQFSMSGIVNQLAQFTDAEFDIWRTLKRDGMDPRGAVWSAKALAREQ